MADLTVTYCTPEDVAETLDLPDPEANYGYYQFSDVSHPSYNQVCRMIRSNEEIIDRRLRHSWRENRVSNTTLNINRYWHDENSWRNDYYIRGGNFVQLRKDMRPWDPSLGDKLEMRSRRGGWEDVSDSLLDEDGKVEGKRPIERNRTGFWFDYHLGRLFIYSILTQTPYNGIRIAYRWGDTDNGVPDDIQRLCCLMTASQIINMQAFNVKVGMGGDISGVKDAMLRGWQEEMNQIWSAHQRGGMVRPMW